MTFRYVAPSFVAYVLTGIADDLELYGHDEGMRALVIARTRRFVECELKNVREHPPLEHAKSLGSSLPDKLTGLSEERENGDIACLS